jgi:hypothetical protein
MGAKPSPPDGKKHVGFLNSVVVDLQGNRAGAGEA